MGKILLFLLIASAGIGALARPWIGVHSYYLLAILGPQYIWWWNFEGLRVSFVISICTILGVLYKVLESKYNYQLLINKQNFWVALLWFAIAISYLFGPYATNLPGRLLYASSVIFIFYFISVMEIDRLFKLRILVLIFVVSTIFLTYWANKQYLDMNLMQFNNGRLMGPYSLLGGAIYKDENAFAMLFVTGLPFVYYYAWVVKRLWLRCALWLVIPLGWHAVFLTGSRGGLVGLLVIVLLVIFSSKRKFLAMPLILLFLFFFQWQAGDTMKSRSDTIADYDQETSAQMRIDAWTGGMRMIADHPLTGVGLGTFANALPDYHDTAPRVAHNTFMQFAAESGVFAGIAYIAILFNFFRNFRRIHETASSLPEDEESQQINLYNKASFVSFSGLIVCSLFLSLNNYEIFFVLLIISNSLNQICKNLLEGESLVEETEQKKIASALHPQVVDNVHGQR
jgi:probable O-glycosylation ligase (exosortase A-associated)